MRWGLLLLLVTMHASAQVTMSGGVTITNGVSLSNDASCRITTQVLAPATLGIFYDTFIQTANCTPPLTFSVSAGTFPSWATLNPFTGEISGTPSVAGTSSFTIQVVDNRGQQSFLNGGFNIVASNGGAPALPDSQLLNWPTAMASTPTSNITICVGTPVNAALLPGGSCNTTYTATAGGLTLALAGAACGQVINIVPGTFGAGLTSPYVGVFSFPNINCPNNNWLWITRDLSDPTFPAEGTRVDPCYMGIPQNKMPYEPYPLADSTPNTCARHMPQFICNVTSGNSCWGWPYNVNARAGNHVRFIGIEFTRDESFDSELVLFDFDFQPTPDCTLVGSGNNALPTRADLCQADQPNFVIFDRCILHGSAQRQTVIGLKLAGATWVALVDSYAYDFGVTYAGGDGDSHFYGGGSGHGYTGVGHWIFKNNFSESSTMASLFCGAFCEARSSTTQDDGVPKDVAWQQEFFWKKPLWDTQLGQAYNAAVTVEGRSYAAQPVQEFNLNPSAVSVAQGNSFQLQTVWLHDSFGGLNRAGFGVTPTIDGISYKTITSSVGIIVKNNEHPVGVLPFISANQVTWVYVACSGAGAPIAACTAATTPGVHVISMSTGSLSNVLGSQGNNLQLTSTSTVTVTAGAPTHQIAVSPNSTTLSIQPSYSDTYFNVRPFCYTMFAFPNYSPASISWTVDGIANGNATVGTITHVSGTTYSGTSPDEVAYCSGTGTGNHSIVATGNDATASPASVINVSASAAIIAYDLKAFVSKNGWELKCGQRILLEKSLGIMAFGGAGNGGGQPGWWLLMQTINQAGQTIDGSGVTVGYGPEYISDVTVRNFHSIHYGNGMALASLNTALGLHRVLITNAICEDCDFTRWMNGFQKRANVMQFTGSANNKIKLSWTSPATPLVDNVTVTHITYLGPVTSQLSIANNNFQSQLGPFTWKNNVVSSTGPTTFFNNNGDVNDCNAGNTEALAFQGTGYTPAKPCFSTYTFTPNVFMDSAAPSSDFTSPNIFQPAATSVGFVNYNGGNGGDYRLCTTALCGFNSQFAAGQINQADDGLDQGADATNQAIYDNAVRTGIRTP